MEHLSISDYIASHQMSIRDKRDQAIAEHRQRTRATMAVVIGFIAPHHTNEDVQRGMDIFGPCESAVEMACSLLGGRRARLKMWEQQTIEQNLGYHPLISTGLERARQDYYTWLENLLIVRRVVGFVRMEEMMRFGESVEINMGQGRQRDCRCCGHNGRKTGHGK